MISRAQIPETWPQLNQGPKEVIRTESFARHTQEEGPDTEPWGQGGRMGESSGTRMNLLFFLIFSNEHVMCHSEKN